MLLTVVQYFVSAIVAELLLPLHPKNVVLIHRINTHHTSYRSLNILLRRILTLFGSRQNNRNHFSL
jgi:hypothetical protein